ncbi:universal stress protein [Amycolatopsis dongchuanensis]|uniref:Universal stress protein n=1 Tax=Amycolatopsis dongchuanensis TaxID=1070866 RepID=A0ABP8VE46_9PSEU
MPVVSTIEDERAVGRIVVGIDGSARALEAVRWAAREAASRHVGLHLVSGFDPAIAWYGEGGPVPPVSIDSVEQAAKADLVRAAAVAREVAPRVPVRTERARHQPVPLLLDESRRALMIVLGASGRGGYRGMLTGSTAVLVVAHAACPVVVVRPPGTRGGPVVVGVDGSPASARALEVAFDAASRRGVPLVAVHSWSDADYVTLPVQYGLIETAPTREEQARVLAECLAGWQEKYPDVRVDRVVLKDRPRHCLLEWSGKAQLVVVGSRGRGGFQGILLGSTSQALLHHARCPVLVVRP